MVDVLEETTGRDRSHPIGATRLGPEKPGAPLSQPGISLVIAFSDHTQLDSILEALARQTVGAGVFEVILVDAIHRLDEQTVHRKVEQAAAAGLDLRFERIKRGGRAAANNYGIQRARSELVLLLADDFIPLPRLVAEHLALHDRQPQRHIVGVGPGIFPPQQKFSSFMRWLDDSGELLGVSFTGKDAVIPENYFCAGNTSAKKALLFAARLFDEEFPYDAWDDYELGVRLSGIGMRTVYLPGAVAYHQHVTPVPERRRQMIRAGESAAIFERKHPGPHAWLKECRYAPWQLELAAQWWLIKSLVWRDRQARGRYYHLTLARSFVAAYRRHTADPLKFTATALLPAGCTAEAGDLCEQLHAREKMDGAVSNSN